MQSINFASNILKKSYKESQTKFLDPFTILALNYDKPNEMKKFLLSPEEQFEFFVKVYGKIIDLKEVSDEEGK